MCRVAFASGRLGDWEMRRLVFDRINRICRSVGKLRISAPELRFSLSLRGRRQEPRYFDPEFSPRYTSGRMEAPRRRDGSIHIFIEIRRKHSLRRSPFPVPHSPFPIPRSPSHRRRHRHPGGRLAQGPLHARLARIARSDEENLVAGCDMFREKFAKCGFGGAARLAVPSYAEHAPQFRRVQEQRRNNQERESQTDASQK